MKKLIDLYRKHREIVNYLIVGVLTTVVSLLVYYGLTLTVLDPEQAVQLQAANVISWIAAVVFAYFTNRRFVFQSKDPEIFKECIKFVLSRVSTYLLSVGLNVLLTWLGVNVYVTTIVAAVSVVIANYVISKLLVFRKKEA